MCACVVCKSHTSSNNILTYKSFFSNSAFWPLANDKYILATSKLNHKQKQMTVIFKFHRSATYLLGMCCLLRVSYKIVTALAFHGDLAN